MTHKSRVAYSLGPQAGPTPETYTVSVGRQRAQQIVRKGGFAPARKMVELLTTAGWRTIDSE